ncbi:DENN domain-like containing protein, implicated in vesicle formation/trafficking [Schizosaccharomyces osmophilus]|uniref:DENN domain-like containing protein, implicated in vesicle formation/trafficking n=1 Tax=Schizosaccharomyces osmophilus TaxID=2545709 RepID=A0AAE9W9N2_9SCHI|nr:DENN domain-like containing protein, implicated in vesicle formation/trafficking [Schizosaccharomyces osmophilus]WBW71908.1 DENN domain-like containing protein, implicated in vesicle formation/trafficking [Schizosaccharomyces osmophilus]
MSVCAIVDAMFEAREGYQIKRIFPDNVSLEGIEYSLFPSGIQQLDRCMVAFRFRNQLCLSVYRKKLGEYYERNAYFSSIGILLEDVNMSVEEAAAKYLNLLDFVSKAIVSPSSLKDPENVLQFVYHDFQKAIQSSYNAGEPLEEYQQGLQSAVIEQDFSAILSIFNTREQLTYDSFSPSLVRHYYSLIDNWLGPVFLILYKCLMQKKRILLVSSPSEEIYSIMDSMTRLTSVSGEENRVLPNPLCKFYSVGLTDIDILENSNQESGWIASTTDSVLLSKSSLYDVAFIWPTNPLSKPGPPKIQLSNGYSLKHSYEDLLNSRLISDKFDPRIASTSKFTNYSIGAIIHIILFNSTRFHLVQSLVSTNQTNLFAAFPRYNQFLLNLLNQHHDSIGISDMRNFGWNPFRQLDRDFVFNVAQFWVHKHVHYRYPSYAYLMQPTAWGVHSLLLFFSIWKRSVPTMLIYLLLLKWWYS